MTQRTFGRRAALLLPLVGLSGCGLFDGDLFESNKPKLPGKREAVIASQRTLVVDAAAKAPPITLPPPVRNAAWPQAGGNPAHYMGHLEAAPRLAEAWKANLGEGGGYRNKILAPPVIAGGTVFAMDSSGVVSAYASTNGHRMWRFDTVSDETDSTNVGGGLAFDGGALFTVNGIGDLHKLDPARGKVIFHKSMGVPARSAPTIADGRLYVSTIEGHMLAFATDDGRQLWSYESTPTLTAMLGVAAPAFSDGLVVAGFGSGELACLRAGTGTVAWTDDMASTRGHESLADLSSIVGRPVIVDGRVYAISLGRLLVCIDLRSGRRLWDREVAGQDNLWVAGDWLFLISSDQRLAAISLQDGRVAWVQDLPRYDDPEKQTGSISWFGPVLVGDRLVVAGTKNQALAVSPYTGEVIGRQDLSGAASLSPVVADGTVYIVTDDASLIALR
jgi:outer membrane protein assembly factor BamB